MRDLNEFKTLIGRIGFLLAEGNSNEEALNLLLKLDNMIDDMFEESNYQDEPIMDLLKKVEERIQSEYGFKFNCEVLNIENRYKRIADLEDEVYNVNKLNDELRHQLNYINKRTQRKKVDESVNFSRRRCCKNKAYNSTLNNEAKTVATCDKKPKVHVLKVDNSGIINEFLCRFEENPDSIIDLLNSIESEDE